METNFDTNEKKSAFCFKKNDKSNPDSRITEVVHAFVLATFFVLSIKQIIFLKLKWCYGLVSLSFIAARRYNIMDGGVKLNRFVVIDLETIESSIKKIHY